MLNAVTKPEGDGAPESEIEVTPEMIEAGVEAYFAEAIGLESSGATRQMVSAVYRAMMGARVQRDKAELISALDASGYAIVPREPTKEMVKNGTYCRIDSYHESLTIDAKDVWKTMIDTWEHERSNPPPAA